jgi:hypothetical protein
MQLPLATAALAAACMLPPAAFSQGCNTADRAVLLVLDASGSMNARLPNGETRFAAAKRAIKGAALSVPGQAQLSLRVYGAQSPARDKDCSDSRSAVPFAAANAAAAAIAGSVDGAKAQGYTPIAHTLEQAAGDFPPDVKERVIVLVSDGKETCRGDPAVASKALAARGITIHTIGFVVDTAARMQLENIARATGGSYFDAPLGSELPDTLKSALAACKRRVVPLPPKPKPGKLRTTSAVHSHAVFNSESGQRAGVLDRVTHEIALPAGTYEVEFGPSRWKAIEIRPGETTTIQPGLLRLENRAGVVRVVDSETAEEFGQFDAASPSVTLMPGLYDLKFGKAEWRFVKVDGGKTTSLKPAQVRIARGSKWQNARVTTREGTEVFRFDAVTWNAVLPPGDYVIEVDGNRTPFPAKEGDDLEVKPQ